MICPLIHLHTAADKVISFNVRHITTIYDNGTYRIINGDHYLVETHEEIIHMIALLNRDDSDDGE